MKRIVLLFLLFFGIGIQANNSNVKALTPPTWYICELYAEQQATNDGYEFNTMPWYHARNYYRSECMAQME